MFTYASKTYVLRKPHIYYNMKALLQDIAYVMYTSLYMQKSTISNNNTIVTLINDNAATGHRLQGRCLSHQLLLHKTYIGINDALITCLPRTNYATTINI